MEPDKIRALKAKSLARFVRGVTHELNNQLTSISGCLSLATVYAPSDTDATLKKLTDGTASINATMEFSRLLHSMSEGVATLRGPINMGTLVESVVSNFLKDNPIKATVDIADSLCSIEGDEVQIKNVLTELLLNATNAAKDDGLIEIRAQDVDIDLSVDLPLTAGHYVRISVKDNGVGIEQDDIANIFDPYFTTYKNKKGLGLTIADAIIREHKGYITVTTRAETEDLTGCIFEIYLPALKSASKTITSDESDDAKDITKTQDETRQILFINAPDITRGLISDSLTRSNYKAYFAGDDKTAAQIYNNAVDATGQINFLVVDLTGSSRKKNMAFVKILVDINPNLIAIAVSDDPNDTLIMDYAAFGFSSAIIKPYRVDDLLKTIERAFEEDQ